LDTGFGGVVSYQALIWLAAVVLGLLWEGWSKGGLALLPRERGELRSEWTGRSAWPSAAAAALAILLVLERLMSLAQGAPGLAVYGFASFLTLGLAALALPAAKVWVPEQGASLRLSGILAAALMAPWAAGGDRFLAVLVHADFGRRLGAYIVPLGLGGVAWSLAEGFAQNLGEQGRAGARDAWLALAAGLLGGLIAGLCGAASAGWAFFSGVATLAALRGGALTAADGRGRAQGCLRVALELALLLAGVLALRASGLLQALGLSPLGLDTAAALAAVLVFGVGLALEAGLSARLGRASLWSVLKRPRSPAP
jgi:hypothetical protein